MRLVCYLEDVVCKPVAFPLLEKSLTLFLASGNLRDDDDRPGGAKSDAKIEVRAKLLLCSLAYIFRFACLKLFSFKYSVFGEIRTLSK
jgi:hypothetical protein